MTHEITAMKQEVTLFVVDDDEIDTELVIRGLRKVRIANEVVTARDGLEALEMLRAGQITRPYVILLDINMPRMNGHEFLRELRADPVLRTSVVFVLTTSSADTDKVKAYEQFVAGYVVKDRAGEDFSRLIEMLDHYWKLVELPNGSDA